MLSRRWCVVYMYVMTCGIYDIDKLVVLLFMKIFIIWFVTVTNIAVDKVSSVASNQEEADTRIVLHAIYAANNSSEEIEVRSPGTDVLVLLLHHRTEIHTKYIYFRTGTQGKRTYLSRYIPVHILFEELSRQQHNILLSVYCLTGCATTIACRGSGKKAAFRILMNKASHFQALTDLGSRGHNKLQLWQEQCYCMDGTTALISMSFVVKRQLRTLLPPTDDSFQLHLLRSVYQLALWRQSRHAMIEIPGPVEHGHEMGSRVTKILS